MIQRVSLHTHMYMIAYVYVYIITHNPCIYHISNKRNAYLSPSFFLGGRPWSGALCEVILFEHGLFFPHRLGNVDRENGACSMIFQFFWGVFLVFLFGWLRFTYVRALSGLLKMGNLEHASLTFRFRRYKK